jgi:hypothetical protein
MRMLRDQWQTTGTPEEPWWPVFGKCFEWHSWEQSTLHRLGGNSLSPCRSLCGETSNKWRGYVDMRWPSQDLQKILRMFPAQEKEKGVGQPKRHLLLCLNLQYHGQKGEGHLWMDYWCVTGATISGCTSTGWFLMQQSSILIHFSYLLVVNIAKKRGETNPEHLLLK